MMSYRSNYDYLEEILDEDEKKVFSLMKDEESHDGEAVKVGVKCVSSSSSGEYSHTVQSVSYLNFFNFKKIVKLLFGATLILSPDGKRFYYNYQDTVVELDSIKISDNTLILKTYLDDMEYGVMEADFKSEETIIYDLYKFIRSTLRRCFTDIVDAVIEDDMVKVILANDEEQDNMKVIAELHRVSGNPMIKLVRVLKFPLSKKYKELGFTVDPLTI